MTNTNTNTTVLFIVGLIFGILLTLSIVEHGSLSFLQGFSSYSSIRNHGDNSPSIPKNVIKLSNDGHKIQSQSLEQLTDTVDNGLSVVTDNLESIFSPAASSPDATPEEIKPPAKVKWSPGNVDLSQYRQAAQQAQESMLAANTPSDTSSSQISQISQERPNINPTADQNTPGMKSDWKTQQKQVKKLKKLEKTLLQSLETHSHTDTILLANKQNTTVSELQLKLQEVQNRLTTLQQTVPTVLTGKTPSSIPVQQQQVYLEGDTLVLPPDLDYTSYAAEVVQGEWGRVRHANGVVTPYHKSYRDRYPATLTLYDQVMAFRSHYTALLRQKLWSDQGSEQGGDQGSVQQMPAVLTYAQATSPLPDMTQQKGLFEANNLHLHLCNGVFEAYSASYLTTSHHLLATSSESYNLSWVNCEMASFVHMKESRAFTGPRSGPQVINQQHGLILQSLDVLDYAVLHLSAFERSSKKYAYTIPTTKGGKKFDWKNIEAVINTQKHLETLSNPFFGLNLTSSLSQQTLLTQETVLQALQQHSLKNVPKSAPKSAPTSPNLGTPNTIRYRKYLPEAEQTLVIMPFLGGAMGAGHSELSHRYEYLRAGFWSLFSFFPAILIAVTTPEDMLWAMEQSNLPFYDVILIEGLPKSAGLPVATTQQIKLRLLKSHPNYLTFRYFFFSESDQILLVRKLSMLYAHLQAAPGHMLLPHRLMPYSLQTLQYGHHRTTSTSTTPGAMSCCLQRQNCLERKSWKALKDVSVPIVQYYDLYVPLGNVNFLREEYRTCVLSEQRVEYCP